MKASFALASLAPLAALAGPCKPHGFKNLVMFGDSATDEARLNYMHMNQAQPPPGIMLEPSNVTSSGGHSWPHFVAEKTGVKRYNYAVGGSVCSSDIVTRDFGALPFPFLGVKEDQIPLFTSDLDVEGLYPDRTADNTVYTLLVGGNDQALGGFLNDAYHEGHVLPDVVDCMWDVLDGIYQTGGRRLVIFTQLNFAYSPQYNLPEVGGYNQSLFWPDKLDYNTTDVHFKMMQYSSSVTQMIKYGAPFQHVVEQRWPGATVHVFDLMQLLQDIYDSPEDYLDTPAFNIESYMFCDIGDPFPNCPTSEEHEIDSFLWYDDVHPTPRARTFSPQTNACNEDTIVNSNRHFYR